MSADGRALDPTEVPRLASGVAIRACHDHAILAAPDGRAHLQVDLDRYRRLDDLGGTTTAGELERRFGPAFGELLTDLHDGGFLTCSPARPPRFLAITSSGIEVDLVDRLVRPLHRVVRPLVSWAGAGAAGCLGFGGLVALAFAPAPDVTVDGALTAGWAVVLAVVVRVVIGVLHEAGHALVVVHHGRRVGRVGVGFYWGLVSCYVDATDALVLSRRHRVQQAAAGPVVDVATGGVLAIAAVVLDHRPEASVLAFAAGVCYLGVLLNLTPLLQLDGYWIVADLLDMPDLEHRALAALRSLGSTRDRTLAVYAAVALVVGAGLLVVALRAWWDLFGGLVRDLLAAGSVWPTVLVVLLGGPLVLLVATPLVRVAEQLVAARRDAPCP